MDLEVIITFISSVGFPIVAFYLMFNQNTKILEELRESVTKLSEVVEKMMLLHSLEMKRGEDNEKEG